MPVFVKASRRAKAYVRSSIARSKKLQTTMTKVFNHAGKPGSKLSPSRRSQLEKVYNKLDRQRASSMRVHGLKLKVGNTIFRRGIQ